MALEEDRVEAIAKAYCESQGGDSWESQPVHYRKNVRRIVRSILSIDDRLRTSEDR